MSFLLIGLIRLYQLTLSKLLVMVLGPLCRFEPSCSRYAVACLQGHGAIRGSLLSAKRLCRCHPFNPGGYDPPPPPRRPRGSFSQSLPESAELHASGYSEAPLSELSIPSGSSPAVSVNASGSAEAPSPSARHLSRERQAQ